MLHDGYVKTCLIQKIHMKSPTLSYPCTLWSGACVYCWGVSCGGGAAADYRVIMWPPLRCAQLGRHDWTRVVTPHTRPSQHQPHHQIETMQRREYRTITRITAEQLQQGDVNAELSRCRHWWGEDRGNLCWSQAAGGGGVLFAPLTNHRHDHQ